MLEYQVDIAVIVGLDHIVQFNYVRMFAEFLQEHNFSICSLLTMMKNKELKLVSIEKVFTKLEIKKELT